MAFRNWRLAGVLGVFCAVSLHAAVNERASADVAPEEAGDVGRPTLADESKPDGTPDLGVPDVARPRQQSRSIGWPWRGRLVDGVQLRESDAVRHVDAAVEHGRFWGTAELVGMVERAARRVSETEGGRLNVGELSGPVGGRVPGHRSHRNGRDIDVGFYLVDEEARPVEPKRFIPVRASGRASWGGPVRFDETRNWLLLESLLEDPDAHVKYVFVAESIRRRLLRTALRRNVDETLYNRAQRVLLPPTNVGNPHLDHFHVRIYCPAKDVPECRDRAPYWPWLPEHHPFAALAALSGPNAAGSR